MKKVLGVIPSRYASTRFPGKPLVDINGKSMIRRVVEQCQRAEKLDKVIVATDDKRIYDHVLEFGGNAMMTADTHKSGTERCGEVIEKRHLLKKAMAEEESEDEEPRDALYFSRHPIPFMRGKRQSEWLANANYYKHIGIYAFNIDEFYEIQEIEKSMLEDAESLENLRWLSHHFTIQIAEIKEDIIGIDTPEDLNKINFN